MHYQLGTLQQAWQLIRYQLDQPEHAMNTAVYHVFPAGQAEKIMRYYQKEQTQRNVQRYYQSQQVSVITVYDDAYPNQLLEMYLPPVVLFCRGNLALLQQKSSICFVGNDRLSYYGEQLITTFVPQMQSAVVTGMLNTTVSVVTFEKALQCQLPMIVVLTSGMADYTPLRTLFLRQKIETKGLVISEYPFEKKHQVSQLKRAREVMIGLSKVVCVVEASQQDYSLLCAYCAVEQNKEVLVPPANLFTRHSEGSNQLLKEGASLLLAIEDIDEALHDKRSHVKTDGNVV